jgi:hypothetical protein
MAEVDACGDANALFGGMFEAMENPEEFMAAAPAIDDGINAMVAAVRMIAPKLFVPAKITPPRMTVPVHDTESNIACQRARVGLAAEQVYRDTATMTQPRQTTITASGFIANVMFHEQQLIERLQVSNNIVVVTCNFGRKQYDGYITAIRSNRGRKPAANKRRKQGDGKNFNSQLSFHVRAREGARVYKFKVFRNGEVQLPGITSLADLDEVVFCTNIIVEELNNVLHPGEFDETKRARLIHLNPVMKNYKFVIKMDSNTHMIALDTLRDKILQSAGEQISDVKYGKQETKLSVKFRTPTRGDKNKELTLTVFMSGKINILGGLDATRATEICGFLDNIITQWRHRIVVVKGGLQIIEPNIEQDDDLCNRVCELADPRRVIFDSMTDEEISMLALILS